MSENLKFGLQLELRGNEVVVRGVEGVRGSIQDLEKDVTSNSKATQQGVTANQSFTESFKSLQGAAKLVGGYIAAIGVTKFVSALYDVNAETQRLQASLVTVTGSQREAIAAWDELEVFASSTPYALDQSINAFVKMQALGLDPTIDKLRSFGNTSSAMGKDLSQMIEAVADASTGEFERLKEFGIKARAQGDQVSFIFQGITTTVKNNSGEITKYLEDIGNVQFAGAMDRQMDTLGGSASNLGDNFDALLRAIGEQGGNAGLSAGMDWLSKMISGVTDAIDELDGHSIESASKRIQQLEADLERLGNRFNTKDYGTRRSILESQLAGVREELLQLKAAKGDADAVSEIMTRLNAELAGIQDERATGLYTQAQRDRVAEIRTELATLEETLAATTDVVEEAETAVFSLSDAQQKLLDTLYPLEAKQAALNESIQSMDALIVAGAGNVDQYIEAKARLQRQLEALQSPYDELIDKMAQESDSLAAELVATMQGTEALAAFNREKAIEIELRKTNTEDLSTTEIEQLRERIAATYDASLALSDYQDAAKLSSDAQQKLLETLFPLKARQQELQIQIETLNDLIIEGGEHTDLYTAAKARLQRQLESMQTPFDALIDNLQEETQWLEKELAATTAGEQALKSFNREKHIEIELRSHNVEELAPQEVALLRDEIAARYDATRALDDYRDAADKAAAAQGDTNNAMDTFITEIVGSFASGADSIGDVFEDLWDRIKREFINAGIANILQLNSPGTPLLSGISNILSGGGAAGSGGGVISSLTGSLTSALSGLNGFVNNSLFSSINNSIMVKSATNQALTGWEQAYYNTSQMPGGIVGGSLMTAGAGIAGGYAGNALGESIFNKQAESNWGQVAGGIGGAYLGAQIGSIGGPLGAALGAAIGALADVVGGGDGKKRVSLGVITDPTFTETQYQTTGASGLKLSSWANRVGTEGQSAANTITDVLAYSDTALTNLYKVLGTNVNLSGQALGGKAPGAGDSGPRTFFGSAEFNKVNNASLESVVDDFIGAWQTKVQSLTGEIIDLQPFDPLIREGEVLADTILRIQGESVMVNAMLGALGLHLFDVSVAGMVAADGLVTAMGGFDNLARAADFYYQNFFTAQERSQLSVEQYIAALDQFNSQFGVAIQSKADLREYVDALDISTEAGQAAFAAALQLAPALVGLEAEFGSLAEAVDVVTGATAEQIADWTAQISEAVEQAMGRKIKADELKWAIDQIEFGGESIESMLVIIATAAEATQYHIARLAQAQGFLDELAFDVLTPMEQAIAREQSRYDARRAQLQAYIDDGLVSLEAAAQGFADIETSHADVLDDIAARYADNVDDLGAIADELAVVRQQAVGFLDELTRRATLNGLDDRGKAEFIATEEYQRDLDQLQQYLDLGVITVDQWAGAMGQIEALNASAFASIEQQFAQISEEVLRNQALSDAATFLSDILFDILTPQEQALAQEATRYEAQRARIQLLIDDSLLTLDQASEGLAAIELRHANELQGISDRFAVAVDDLMNVRAELETFIGSLERDVTVRGLSGRELDEFFAQEDYQASLAQLQSFIDLGVMSTQEQAEALALIEAIHADTLAGIASQYSDLAAQTAVEMERARATAGDFLAGILQSMLSPQDQAIAQESSRYSGQKAQLQRYVDDGLLTLTEAADGLAAIEIQHARVMQDITDQYTVAVADLTGARAELDAFIGSLERDVAVRNLSGRGRDEFFAQEDYQAQLAQLRSFIDLGVVSIEEQAQALALIEQIHADTLAGIAGQYADLAASARATAGDFLTGLLQSVLSPQDQAIAQESSRYAEQKAQLQRYVDDGLLTLTEAADGLAAIELQHARVMQDITDQYTVAVADLTGARAELDAFMGSLGRDVTVRGLSGRERDEFLAQEDYQAQLAQLQGFIDLGVMSTQEQAEALALIEAIHADTLAGIADQYSDLAAQTAAELERARGAAGEFLAQLAFDVMTPAAQQYKAADNRYQAQLAQLQSLVDAGTLTVADAAQGFADIELARLQQLSQIRLQTLDDEYSAARTLAEQQKANITSSLQPLQDDIALAMSGLQRLVQQQQDAEQQLYAQRLGALESERSLIEQIASERIDALANQRQSAVQELADARSGVDNFFDGLRRSIQSRSDQVSESSAAQIDDLNAQAQQLKDIFAATASTNSVDVSGSAAAIKQMQSITDLMTGALKDLRPDDRDSVLSSRSDALAALRDAITGELDTDVLSDAVRTLSTDAKALFATREDYLRDLYQTQNAITGVLGRAGGQLSLEEQTLALLQQQSDDSALQHEQSLGAIQQQIEAIIIARDDQLAALQQELVTGQSALDALNGVYNGINSLGELLGAITSYDQQRQLTEQYVASIDEQIALTQQTATQQIDALNAQMEQERELHEQTLASIDAQVVTAQAALGQLTGVYTGVNTLAEVMASIATFSDAQAIADAQLAAIDAQMQLDQSAYEEQAQLLRSNLLVGVAGLEQFELMVGNLSAMANQQPSANDVVYLETFTQGVTSISAALESTIETDREIVRKLDDLLEQRRTHHAEMRELGISNVIAVSSIDRFMSKFDQIGIAERSA